MMKSVLSILVLSLMTQMSQASCLSTLTDAALNLVSQETGLKKSELLLVRTEMGIWTEAVGNNTGHAEVAILVNGIVNYFHVVAQQIGATDQCSPIGFERVSDSDVPAQVRKAEKLKIAIGNATHYSESDSEWTVYYSPIFVTGFTKKQLRQVLQTSDPLEVWSATESKEFLNHYINEGMEEADRAKYARLLETLKSEVKQFRVIKVGKPDSGSLDLYILGITEDGEVVGLQTITVET